MRTLAAARVYLVGTPLQFAHLQQLWRRRLNLIAAVEGDDWSAVIDAQTSATLPEPLQPAAPSAAAPQIESPFSHANVHRSIGMPGNMLLS